MSSRHLFGEAGLKAMYCFVVDNFLAVVTVPLAVAAALIAVARFGPDELALPVHYFVAAFLPAAAATMYLMLPPRTAPQHRANTCVLQEEDKGNLGTNLNKDLMTIAADALKANITAICPLVLPASEQLLFALSFIARKVLGGKFKPYITNFRMALQNFCIRAGGRAIIDKLQRSLNMSDDQVEAPLRMALHGFGNTSSRSPCYELAYIEAKGRMRTDQVCMIGLGSGFKCNSAAQECIEPAANPEGSWVTSIHKYPVDINNYCIHSKL